MAALTRPLTSALTRALTRSLAFASGGGPVNVDLANDGYAIPFWNSAGPTGVYSERTGKLWMLEEGSFDNGTPTRRYHVRTRDMISGECSPVCFIGNVPAAADYHGPAAICELPAPATGHFMVVGGDHDGGGSTGFRVWVTQTPDEPAGWREVGTLGTELSYPHLAVVGDQVWAIHRTDEGGMEDGLQYRSTSAIADDGTPTWNAAQAFVSPTTGRCYMGIPKVAPWNGTEIHFCWTRANAGDTQRWDVFYGIINTTDGSFMSFDGNTITEAASLPIDDTAAAAYLLFDIDEGADENTAIPQVHFDAEQHVHVVWSQGVDGDLTAKHSIYDDNTDEWVTRNIGQIETRYGPIGIQDTPDDGVLITFSGNGSVQGEVWGVKRSEDGVYDEDHHVIWQGPREYGVGGHVAIYPAHVDAGQAFCEVAEDVTEDFVGDLATRVLKGDGTFLPWVRSSYSYISDEASDYDDARTVKLSAVNADLPYFVDRLFMAIKDVGLSNFESYYLLGASAVDNDDWLIDLIVPSRKLLRVNAPEFVPYKGFQGDGIANSGMRLVAPENLNASSIFTQNSCHLGAVTLSTGANANAALGASGGGPQCYIIPSDATNIGCRINSATGQISAANTNTARSMIGRRSASNALALFGEGASIGTSTTASTGRPAAPMMVNSIAGVSHGDHLVFAVHWGASLTADQIQHLYFAGQLPVRRLLAS